MKNIFKILLIGISIVSCSDDDIIPESNNCSLIEYGNTSVHGGYEKRYRNKHKLIYSGEKIVKRINHGNIAPSSGFYIDGEISRDSLIYDSLGRLWKIYQTPLLENYSYSEFEYTNSNKFPFRRNEIHISNYTGSTYKFIYPEDIYYDADNRIIKTVVNYDKPNYEFNFTTNYEYDTNGNLTKKDFKETRKEYTSRAITEYSDYDEKNNPFLSIPLIDFRGVSSSKNNYRWFRILIYYNENLQTSISGAYNYEYNDFDYPLIGEYNCN